MYLVDTGLHREQQSNPRTALSLGGTFPTFQASLRQRECHVADLRPGKSYHLFTQGDLRSWNQFKRPEMRTIDLTKVATLQNFFARRY